MIDAETLHEAADAVATQVTPADGGFAEDAIDVFMEESTFLTPGEQVVGIERGSLAYGIAIGVEAARLEAQE